MFSLKIHTAFVLCLVFIFRLLFVNIGLISELNSAHTNKQLTKYFSSIQKRRRQPQADTQKNTRDYSVIEFCEDSDDNEEDLAKASTPAVLSVLYSFFNRFAIADGSNSPFDHLKYNLTPKKYLALSVLRI